MYYAIGPHKRFSVAMAAAGHSSGDVVSARVVSDQSCQSMRDDSLMRICYDDTTSKTVSFYIGGGDYGPPGSAGLVFKHLKPQQAATLVSLWCKMCGNTHISREAFAVTYPKKQMYIPNNARGQRTDQEGEVADLMAMIDKAIPELEDRILMPPQRAQRRRSFAEASSSTARPNWERNRRQRQ